MDKTFCYRVTVENPKEGRRIFVADELYGLEFAYLDSTAVPDLGPEWTGAGVYAIFTGWAHGIWTAYLGETVQMKIRHSKHRSTRDDTPVLLIRRTTEGGFTSADIALLERLMALDLAVSDTALPVNGHLPKGAIAHPHEHARAHIIGESIRGVLTLLGYPVHRIDISAGRIDAARIPFDADAPNPNDDPIYDDDPVPAINLTAIDLTDPDPVPDPPDADESVSPDWDAAAHNDGP